MSPAALTVECQTIGGIDEATPTLSDAADEPLWLHECRLSQICA
jgi:hypothetical protein